MHVALRPYRADEFEKSLLIRGTDDADSIDRWRRFFEGSGTWVDHYLHLAIDADGLVVGDLQLRRCHATMPPGSLELGIELLEDSRGKGIGTAALLQVTEVLLSDDVHRICGSTDVENAAMIRAFEKAQWTKEGTLRGLFKVDGILRDYVSYSVTSSDRT